MAKKTNKSLEKRVRVTKNGKILALKAGQRHFNAKMSRSKQLTQKRGRAIKISSKDLGTYLPHK